MRVRPLQASDVDVLAVVLGRAFDDDPLFRAILPDAEHRRRALPVLFGEWMRLLHLREPGSFVTDTLDGAALWSSPGRWAIGLTTLARMGPRTLAALGTRTIAGLRVLHAVESPHPKEPPHHYLRVLGCDPDRQGRGIGSRLLEPTLAACDTRGEGAYLESSNEKNHAFYRRHGFEIRAEVVTHLGARAWLMWRKPR